MRKVVVLFFVIIVSVAKADEGMWIPMFLEQLNEADMKSIGLKLSAEDIYSVNNSSLKDAVVHFGGGCTAEVVSGEGLLFTNHHCGYYNIQSHSSVENDYLTNGFWAKNRAEELSNMGLTATFIVRMEDVTAKILGELSDTLTGAERQKIIDKNSADVSKKATEGTHYEATIKPFFYGNEYYMFITETFKDVRLVGAPPSSIGKFGGDTDNWMWPRHTGDFSVFRIYADSLNRPADFSKNNVPYKPKHFFPISLKGVKENDFTMVYGFPGRTQQYLTSYAVDYVVNKGNPAKIKMRDTSLGILKKDMSASDEVRIKYASKYARISNYHKKWIGETAGLKRLNAIDSKKKSEKMFSDLALQRRDTLLFGLMPKFESLYLNQEAYAFARDYFVELVYYGPEIIRFTNGFKPYVDDTKGKKISSKKRKALSLKLQESVNNYFKNYDASTDKKVFVALMDLYRKNVLKEMLPDIFTVIDDKFGGSIQAYADYVYSQSVFSKEESVNKRLGKLKSSALKKIVNDPAYRLMESIFGNYNAKIKTRYDSLEVEIEKLNKDYVKGTRELLPNKKYFPDANSTLRLTYGKIEGYTASNGETMKYYTDMNSLIQKVNQEDEEFKVEQRMLDLYAAKEYGRYGKNENLQVCFTASNHTTGGNSGSPVLDAEGNLIGINFDRSWESTMSDIMFDPLKCRNIVVDVRYVLWVIDKYAEAGYLVDEMKLVE